MRGYGLATVGARDQLDRDDLVVVGAAHVAPIGSFVRRFRTNAFVSKTSFLS